MKLKESEGVNLPIMKFAVRICWSMAMAGATAGGLPVDSLSGLGDKVAKMFDVPEAGVTVEMLKEIAGNYECASQLSEEEILSLLEEYMKLDPNTEWLNKFLNVQDGQEFQKHFGLWKTESTKDSSDVRWLCEKHYKQGVAQQKFKSVPH